jgi:hypothetical protein
MQASRFLIAVVAFLSLLLVAGACDGPSAPTTTEAAASSVVFGRGSVPDTVPSSFPIPDEAVIGATLVDANRGLTEMILNFPADVDAVVAYYEENLPARGFEIGASAGTETEWQIEGEGEGVSLLVTVRTFGNGVASATVELSTI